MSIRSISVRVLAGLLLTVLPVLCQQAPAPAAPAPATPASGAKVPDYPDPRTFVIGVEALAPMTFSGPDIIGGKPAAAANVYESLYNIGKPYKVTPMVEVGLPVTRTGMLYADFERYHGWADQTLTRYAQINTYGYLSGDAIHSTYTFDTGRIYLDDLLYPHKFPVARLRFHSIWGIRYLNLSQSVVSATEDAKAGVGGASYNVGSSYIFYPEFGLGMEYALASHVLFKMDGAGFAIPHRSMLDETSATLSVRHGSLEVLGGVRTLNFRTTPQKEEFVRATIVSPFVGLRWHF